MNYIELIKRFWQLHESHQFSVTEIALYLHLVEICNRCSWTNPFKRNNARICGDLGVSINTIKNARNTLKQAGLINFSGKSGNANVAYQIIERSSEFDEVTCEVSIEVGSEVTCEVSARLDTTKDKLNKTKLTNIPPNPQKGKEKKEKFCFEFIEEEFKDSMLMWLEYKKQRRESYKTQKSLELCYKQLKELSNNSPFTATKVVERSMSNNWAGLFKLQENETDRRSDTAESDSEARKRYIIEKAARAVAECNSGNT